MNGGWGSRRGGRHSGFFMKFLRAHKLWPSPDM